MAPSFGAQTDRMLSSYSGVNSLCTHCLFISKNLTTDCSGTTNDLSNSITVLCNEDAWCELPHWMRHGNVSMTLTVLSMWTAYNLTSGYLDLVQRLEFGVDHLQKYVEYQIE